jgi:hypothetical protein
MEVAVGPRRKGTDGSEQRLLPASALSPGELDTSDEYYYRWFTAGRFLNAVITTFPEARAELESCPFSYSMLKKDMRSFVLWVRRWARDNRIESRLVVTIAGKTLLYWKEAGEHGPIGVDWSLERKTADIEKPLLPLFDPLLETRALWLQRVKDWTDRVIAEYRAQGYVRSRRKNQPSHYHWLARHTVGRETVSEIALDVKRGGTKSNDRDPEYYRQRVDDAIRRLAKAIDLSLK